MSDEQWGSEDPKLGAYLIQFSVVISGEIHNPSILNPDFLALRDIIPSEWEWETNQVVTTPALSLVSYTNSLSITVEPSKLQVVDAGTAAEGSVPNSKAADIAQRYVSALPHVRYTAVGVNFVSAIERENPEDYLKGTFLKQGRWDSASYPLSAVGLRLAYPIPNGRLLLTLDTGEAQRADEELGHPLTVVLASSNFHRECSDYPADKEIGAHLAEVAEDRATHAKLLRDILKAED
jgi:hypothetical protein